jgi:DNA-binding Lrp family transcriptional regulator
VVTAFVLVDAEPARIAALGAALAATDGVSEVYSVTGDDDLLAVIRVAEHEQVATLVTESIATLEGVTSTRTLIAFRQYDPADTGF